MDDQKTEVWLKSRLGKATASRVSDIMARTQAGKPAASRKNYMMELLCQRLTGFGEDIYITAAMQRGTDLEPVARSWYEVEKGVFVQECGLIDHPTIVGFAASPDGLIGDEGNLEIKCPNTMQHLTALLTNEIDPKYQWQMLAQMACSGRQWSDYVSFDDRFPDALQGHCIRFPRDEARIKEMENEVLQFLVELAVLEGEMRERINTVKGLAA